MIQPRRKERGQILIPALFVFPSIFLFIILIIETTRLSADKIHHQFALDAGASVEMEQYADYFNRLTYINGAFPDRVFKEIYPSQSRWQKDYGDGFFPASVPSVTADQPKWIIRFAGKRAYLNTDDPPMELGIFKVHSPDSQIHARMALFDKIYYILGNLTLDHQQIFDSVTQHKHDLMRKSMWLNSGEGPSCPSPSDCATEAVKGFNVQVQTKIHYLQGIIDHDGDAGYDYPSPGLFQLATIPKDELQQLKDGLLIKQSWIPGGNYWNVDFNGIVQPYVRAVVNVAGGTIWPNPTPKFQEALSP